MKSLPRSRQGETRVPDERRKFSLDSRAGQTSAKAQAYWAAARLLGRDLNTAEGPCRRDFFFEREREWDEAVHAQLECRYGQGLTRGSDLPGEIVSRRG